MANLFSPLTIGGRELPNRITMSPRASGTTSADGFASQASVDYYERRARGGVGLVLTEPLRVAPPAPSPEAHLGLYHDAFVPGLRCLVRASQAQGARVLLTLDEPAPSARCDHMARSGEAFVLAAWRAHCAGADGIMLTAADGGLLYHLLSPLGGQGARQDGQSLAEGQRVALAIIEEVRHWLGRRLIVGFRLLADEFTPAGLTLQDARVLAKRLTSAGVQLLDVTTPPNPPGVARFPGWAVPLASSIRRVVDVPVIGSGELGDPLLADSVVRDGSLDLVMLDEALRRDPDWPLRAQEQLGGAGPPAS